MIQVVSQRELRNDSGRIMSALAKGRSVVVTLVCCVRTRSIKISRSR